MSGGGKRPYEDPNHNLLSPSSKEREEPAEKILNPEGKIDSRPPKLLRVEHSNNKVQIDDSTVDNTSLATNMKGDSKARTIDEKVSLIEKKPDNFEEKGGPLRETSKAGSNEKTRRIPSSSSGVDSSLHQARKIGSIEKISRNPHPNVDPSLHQSTRMGSIEKVGRNPSPSNASTWKRENREDLKELSREGRDDKNLGKKGDNKDGAKDGSMDLVYDGKQLVSERMHQSSTCRRDQRFDQKDDTRESLKGHKESQDRQDSLLTGGKSCVKEEGELRDCEEIEQQQVQEGAMKDEERKKKDHNIKEKEEKEKIECHSLWETDGRKEKEREKEKKEAGNPVEKEDIMNEKQEPDELEVPNKVACEWRSLKDDVKQENQPSKYAEVATVVKVDEKERRDENERMVVSDMVDPEEDKDSLTNDNGQHKKRVFRPRGNSVAVGRDDHPRLPLKVSDSLETPSIIYKPGEYMTELLKLWREFESSKNGDVTSSSQCPTIDIRIPAKLVTTSNHQVKGSQLWGTDIYTDDSDLVAVLMHTGYYRPTASYPPPLVQELCATIQVLPAQDSYSSSLRNNVRSRAWGSAIGCSYSVIRCRIVKVSGGHIDLQPCLTRTSAVAPTLAPVVTERTMTTRAASSNTHRQQRFVQEVTIQYNLCNEPWMKYSMSIVADRGVKKSQYTSARLRKGEVLYLETHSKRYELSYDNEKVGCNGGNMTTTATSAPVFSNGDKIKDRDNERPLCNRNGEKLQGRGVTNCCKDRGQTRSPNVDGFDHYKWAVCKDPLPLKMMLAKGIPLPQEYLEVLENGLAWEEIHWSQGSVWVRGKEYLLARAHFLSSQ